MFKKINIRTTIIAAIAGAVVFCIPVMVFVYRANFTQSWLLYFGSFLFGIVMWIHTIRENKRRGENESTVALIFGSHATTVAGIVISCLLCFLILATMVPGYLHLGTPDKTLVAEPVNTIKDKTDGMSFDVFFAATIVNFSVGSFVAIILPFYSKRNQMRDSREPTPLHQRGTK